MFAKYGENVRLGGALFPSRLYSMLTTGSLVHCSSLAAREFSSKTACSTVIFWKLKSFCLRQHGNLVLGVGAGSQDWRCGLR